MQENTNEHEHEQDYWEAYRAVLVRLKKPFRCNLFNAFLISALGRSVGPAEWTDLLRRAEQLAGEDKSPTFDRRAIEKPRDLPEPIPVVKRRRSVPLGPGSSHAM